MSDIEREEFEQAVKDRWSDSYSFTRFGDEDYYDEVLEGMWWAWQASRQALEGDVITDLKAEILTERDPSDEYDSFLVFVSRGKSEPYLFIPETLDDAILDEVVKRINTHPASADNQAHWSQGSPGLADQYRQEAFAAREALGFSCDSLEVSPADIRQAIADNQAVSVPQQWRDTMEELEERVAELERMVRAFRACVDLQMVPSWGSPYHDQIHALVGKNTEEET